MKKKIKSAIPIYAAAAVWLLLGLICLKMLLKIWFWPIAAALSAAAYFAAQKFFPGREAVQSGDRNVDAMIEQGRSQLARLKAANDAIPDADISAALDRMTNAGEAIFGVLARDPKQMQAVRKFMNYYLPTADKLMQSYRLMRDTTPVSENMARAMESIRKSLSMIADAFEKQLDNLYGDRALDIETDIDVLETLMRADGLIGRSAMGEQKGADDSKITMQSGR